MRAENKKKLYKRNGNTADISQAVQNAYNRSYQQVAELAERLRGTDDRQTCRNVLNYLLKNVRYLEDPAGVQWIKTPARLLHDKVADCKSFSIFVASCLRCLNIRHFFRFVSFSKHSKLPTHVYIVAIIDGETIILDGVTKKFNYEVPYTHKLDTPPRCGQQYDFQRVAGILNVQ